MIYHWNFISFWLIFACKNSVFKLFEEPGIEILRYDDLKIGGFGVWEIWGFKILCFIFQCETTYKTTYTTKYDKKCTTHYKEHCEEHGYGYHKDYKCYKEPVHKCHEVPIKVPHKIPKKHCFQQPGKTVFF